MPGKPKRRQKKRSAPHARQGSLRLALVVGALVLVNLYVFLWRGGTSIPAVRDRAQLVGSLAAITERGSAGPGDASDAPGEGPARAPRPDEEADGTPDEVGRWVEGSVAAGESLGKILRREGLVPAAADEAIRALEPNLDMRSIREGQRYRIRFDDAGKLLEIEFAPSKILTVRAYRGPDGGLVSEKRAAATRLEEDEIGGTVESSLYMAFKAAGEDTALVSFFVDVFAYDLDFYVDQHEGDRFRMVVEKEFVGDHLLRYRRVVAAEYAGRAGTYRAFWWQPPGAKEGGYFNERGESVERTFLKTPLKYARVSSKFNPRRMHPILHVQKGHFGVDYAAPVGTPIWAAAGGRIVFRGGRGGAGNCVILRHDNGLETVYMHLSKFRKGQEVGQRVRPKDVIGYVGTTGLSTGPHLHFAIKQGGHYVDPLKMKMTRGVGVAKKDRPAFEHDTRALVARLASVSVTARTPLAGLERAMGEVLGDAAGEAAVDATEDPGAPVADDGGER
jgi:murein DD-endopeptidase MepM/ murein hydrolase activator NlpD